MGMVICTMNLLVTLNANYIKPLKVMLASLFYNNAHRTFAIYLMHSSLTEEEIAGLTEWVEERGHRLIEVKVDPGCFKDAPILFHYTVEMYYRLLAWKFLPDDLDRILYLDPDILVLNPVDPLDDLDMDGYLFAAAYHDIISITEINRIRLTPYKIDAYYNSGVLLMNLERQRERIREEDIFAFVDTMKKQRIKLIMPDQDIMNMMFNPEIKNLDERIYNYDARYYQYYKLMSGGECDMDYVIRNTIFLHFCGKKKPWKENYSGKFHALYKHYEKMAIG